MNKELIQHTIDFLENCKEGFLAGTDWSWEISLGVEEIRDDLMGIYENGHKCYASYLFSQLSEEDKEEIQRNIDFYVNFEELYSTYDLK